MKPLTVCKTFAILLCLTLPLARCGGASGQVVDNPGFKALPRPINYAMPLAPNDGPKAVIVYGKEAPWTKTAAQAVQKAIEDWSGVKLDLADDRTVTSDETWLLTDACRKTPLIALGNARDNRVMHALGTRYLLQSNRTWPGGDRFVIRSIFEPFAADVNYVVLEASTAAGLDGAVAKFAAMLKGLRKDETATLPRFRDIGFAKDAWGDDPSPWTPPTEYRAPAGRSIPEIALAAAKSSLKLNSFETVGQLDNLLRPYVCGGRFGNGEAKLSSLPPDQVRMAAAMLLNVGRADGGRIIPVDYGATAEILAIRSLMQTGILNEKELNEFENCLVSSAAFPNYYMYDHIGSDSGYINELGGRHSASALLSTVILLDYVRTHCRMDDKTRKEIERRADGARKTTAHFVRSFRDNVDEVCLGETNMLYFYAMLHQGMPDWVRSGNLRRAADCYIMTSDNTLTSWQQIQGGYAGLDCYIGADPGMVKSSWHGRGIAAAAAFYYDDPQYRWYSRCTGNDIHGCMGSVGGPFLPMHWDPNGQSVQPTAFDGVRSLPFDERLYGLVERAQKTRRWDIERFGLPAPLENLVDRVAFRDGMSPRAAYLFLATSQSADGPSVNATPLQNNLIARYTDLGEIWLFTNSKSSTSWSRSMVSISNGKPFRPMAGCTLEALANLDDVSAVASRDHGVGGTDWTRTIVHWRGHYFAVLDRIEALASDEYNLTCRWRGLQRAALDSGAWVARSPTGASLRVQGTDGILQTAEHWENDGAAAPFVFSQYKRTRMAPGQAQTFQNLLYVSGEQRPDEFQARRAGAAAMLVKGKTAAGEYLALIGTDGQVPIDGVETDARIYAVTGQRVCLAGATTLKLKAADGTMTEVFWSDTPVNALVDYETGEGQVEITGEKPVEVKTGQSWMARRPGRSSARFAEAGTLPKPAAALEACWNRAHDPAAPQTVASEQSPFQAEAGADALRRPARRLQFALSSSSAPWQPLAGLTDGQYVAVLGLNQPTWGSTENLEITLRFPAPTPVACLRLVSVLGKNGRSWGLGDPWNAADDFTFSLILSDDDFHKDIRKIENPKVVFESTPLYGALYYSLSPLPTWRIDVGQTATRIKLLPRPIKKDKQGLYLTQIEADSHEATGDLAVNAFAADVDGDGSNELVVGTSNQELAVYRADGKRMWTRSTSPHDIFTMACDDLDENGKSAILVYTTDEKLHRIDGDGSERTPVADIRKMDAENPSLGWSYSGGIVALAAWRPEAKRTKDVALFSQGTFFAQDDGKISFTRALGESRGGGRLHGLFPNEPEVMAAVNGDCVLWSARKDANGQYVRMGSLPMAGPGGANCSRSFGWVQAVNAGAFKGLLAANEGGLNYFPIEAFMPGGKNKGWGFNAGGVPVKAVLAEDVTGDGVPEVFLARQDGFVNVFKLADGSSLGLLNTGEPILGLAMLKGKDGKPCLAVGTKMGVHLFGSDLKLIGTQPMPVAAFAGPGGKDKDRVYVVDVAGNVTVLILKSPSVARKATADRR